MDRPITITPSEMYTAIMAVCGTITAVAAAIAVIAKVIERMRKPNKTQDARLNEHEAWLKRHDKKFDDYDKYLSNDKARLDHLERSNTAFSRYMLALGNFMIGASDKEALKSAINRFQEFILNGEEKNE